MNYTKLTLILISLLTGSNDCVELRCNDTISTIGIEDIYFIKDLEDVEVQLNLYIT